MALFASEELLTAELCVACVAGVLGVVCCVAGVLGVVCCVAGVLGVVC